MKGSCVKPSIANAQDVLANDCTLNSHMVAIAAAAIELRRGMWMTFLIAKDHAVFDICCALKADSFLLAADAIAAMHGEPTNNNVATDHAMLARCCGRNVCTC